MIRVVLFLVLVSLLALAGAWFADRPGEIAITWLGFQIETSVMVAVAAIAAIAVVAVLLWSLIRAVWRSPRRIAHVLGERRRKRGHLALSRGLIAIGAGDVGAARKFSGEADRIAPHEPLALLLSAQTAQLSGDRDGAERAFLAMAARPDTKLLGLRGLYVEAQRRADAVSAREHAEEAMRAAPGLPWAGQAVLEFQCTSADWAGALKTLEARMRGKVIDKDAYLRQRAVLLTAQAMLLAETRPVEARALAVEAARIAPDLTPAAALAARLLVDNGDTRKAARILEAAWRLQPHPDLSDAYANLKSGDSALERLKRVRNLVRARPEHVEASFAVARAALDAQEFAATRTALTPLLAAPTRRVAMMMAELEELQHGDEGRAREWMGRALRAPRDPAWTADGFVSDHWMPISPVTGRLDAFQWRVPVEEIADQSRVIEEREIAPAGDVRTADDLEAAIAVAESGPVAPVAVTPAPAAAPSPVVAPAPAPQPPRRIEPVIPLVHTPDDPGPEGETPPPSAANGRRGRLSFFR